MNVTRKTLQTLVAAIFVTSMFIFSLAVSHAEDKKNDDARENTYVLSYAVKGSFGTASYVTVAGLASQEECNRLGIERTANPDQKHHPFPAGQYTCHASPMRIFAVAVPHAEEDTRINAYVLSYAVKGSFGTASYVIVPGLASQEECNRLGIERTANPDQKHHPFRAGQYVCKPISARIEDEETTGDIKTPK
jgi:hypothetical protein